MWSGRAARAAHIPMRESPTMRRPSGSGFSLMLFVSTLLIPLAALSGPVEVYREGERYCPRTLPPTAPRIDAAQAGRIALKLVPDQFCGPTDEIGGCDLVTENYYDSWRVYVHQYRRIPGAHDWLALTHSYVILDAVGNCIANIPGTEPGARR